MKEGSNNPGLQFCGNAVLHSSARTALSDGVVANLDRSSRESDRNGPKVDLRAQRGKILPNEPTSSQITNESLSVAGKILDMPTSTDPPKHVDHPSE